MHLFLTQRRATIGDVPQLIRLLREDELGKARESNEAAENQSYYHAFAKIDSNPDHYLMVVDHGTEIVGTCHLTLLPSLTFMGRTRLQIEAVRVAAQCRGQKIGEWMINEAIAYGHANGASIIQLTTNKERGRAQKFYERLGFESSHVGMKRVV